MIVLIDNYDSFTYNLYQYLGEKAPVKVIRNDKASIEDIEKLSPSHIVLSPGPGRPENAGICVSLVRQLSGKIPILGVCLGHQAIAQAFGATIDYAQKLYHGKEDLLYHARKSIFHGLNSPTPIARYHSLVVREEGLPSCLEVLGTSQEGEVMAIQHKRHATMGLQFHPESIMTPQGMEIIETFLKFTQDSKGDEENE